MRGKFMAFPQASKRAELQEMQHWMSINQVSVRDEA